MVLLLVYSQWGILFSNEYFPEFFIFHWLWFCPCLRWDAAGTANQSVFCISKLVSRFLNERSNEALGAITLVSCTVAWVEAIDFITVISGERVVSPSLEHRKELIHLSFSNVHHIFLTRVKGHPKETVGFSSELGVMRITAFSFRIDNCLYVAASLW